ncbi:MAG: dienelactone hydrolase family protein [Pseudomonadota bacterium]|nr:dienelactone hydrolase family protein [Pseudomonadota bacterium]
MSQPHEAALSAYERFDFAAAGYERRVYTRGEGPAVVVVHEIPGLHPQVIAFADRIVAAGMSVYLPVLFGEPGRPVDPGYVRRSMFETICIRREFTVWRRGRSSPIVDWLRALAAQAHAWRGGRGVGAVGMCFTGGFALAMMTEPAVVAPVLAQPSLPLPPMLRSHAAAIDLSADEIACVRLRLEREDLTALGLRFAGDWKSPKARFEALAAAFPGRFETIELDDADAAPGFAPPHSTLTVHLAEHGPTKEAERRVIAFLKARTGAGDEAV